MSFVLDTDIISTFAKIGRLKLLIKVFGEEIYMPEAVYQDLVCAQRAGYDYLKQTKDVITITKADDTQLNDNKLGAGEIECIALCKQRSMIFVSNDVRAKSAAEKVGVAVIDLAGILWYLKNENIITKGELQQIIKDIEEKDHTTLLGKEELLK
ncbi:MAG TPA: hypothetical protein VJH88_05225 [Candidatus Nanoarchaeia archaeon]|nr:hypothetical protein [Candidatus Nanoarchaeia archaeon]